MFKLKSKNTIILMPFVLVCLLFSVSRGEDVQSHLANMTKTHPRLFISDDAALRQKINSDPMLNEALSHVTSLADEMQDIAPVERKQVGRRLLGVSRTCLKRITHLALAYRVTGNKKYAARAQKEMLAAAGFSDWNPSHFLDVAEMTAALAIGYDWTYNALDPTARATIKQAIIEKGLKTSLGEHWWITATHNWNQVCHGGLVLGALVVAEDKPDLSAQIIERALKYVPLAMEEYAPDGAYPEGPSYWGYGTIYNVVLIAALQSALGTDFGLAGFEGFLESSDYYLHVTGPTGLYFNYSDCGSRGGVSPAMYWFAAKRDKPELLWRQRQRLERFFKSDHSPASGSNRFLPFVILWSESFETITRPDINHWKADGKTPVGIHKSGWHDDQETYVAVKGGSPGTNHAHMDIGTFVMDALGVRWAEDLGGQSYHDLESKGIGLWDDSQDGQRWDIFRLNNFSHNTLVVNGKKQRVDGHAPIIDFSDDAPMPHTIVDLTSVYEGQLESAQRGVGLYKNIWVLIQDDIRTLDEQTKVRWGMVTKANVDIQANHLAILRREGKRLSLKVLSPDNAKLEIYETADPPRDFDAPNKGTRMVGFKADLPPSSSERFIVLLGPEGERDGVPTIRPLAEWQDDH